MGMPGQGGRSFDIIRQIVGNVVNIFNKRPTVCTAPCDGMVLKMHYQWTFWVMLGGFSAVWYSWFHRDVITCASHFNAETQVRLDYINICLSYPYIEVGSDRRYLLFYRWIHWVLFILAALYYIPRKLSKNAENPKVKKLFEDLAVGVHRYDNYEREMVDRAARYMAFNIKTHNALFYKYLSCNVIALAVDLFAFHFLDYVFQNRFLKLGIQSYPFNRDPKTFTDYMSQTFPPFADCELGAEAQLVNKRTEKLGCHLTVMELYEKLFLALWVWLIFLTIATSLYIIYLFFFWSPWARLHILRVSKPVNAKDTVRNTVVSVLQNCKIGDIYLLYRLRQHFSHARFYDLLTKLSDPDFLRMFLDNVSIDHKGGGGQQDLRHRNKGQMIKSPGKYDMYTKPNKGILVEACHTKMAIVGHGGTDIVRQLVGNVVNIFKKKRAPCTSPCDGFVLKMHYQWTFWLLLAGFSFVWYSWYHRDVITCVNHFNAETQVRLDYINICLSYTFVEEPGQERRYLLFYRWIHWTLLVLAAFYYIPRKFSKNSENPKVKKLIEDLALHSARYDHAERELVERAARYIALNHNTHNGIYFKFVGCNVIALLVDIFCFQALDFVFQGRFINYGWMAFPYERDPVNFSDYMSRTFPPFATCVLDPNNKLVAQRSETLGCHLTVMELYEKVFLIIWAWLIILTTVTCAYLIFLGFMWLPYFRLLILRVAKPPNAKETVSNTIMSVLNCCKIGDVYLLYRLKQHLSHARFYELLTRLDDPEMVQLITEDPADRVVQAKNQDNLRHRQQKMNVGTPKGKFVNPAEIFIPGTNGYLVE